MKTLPQIIDFINKQDDKVVFEVPADIFCLSKNIKNKSESIEHVTKLHNYWQNQQIETWFKVLHKSLNTKFINPSGDPEFKTAVKISAYNTKIAEITKSLNIVND